jgi:hypothetical protein
VPTRAGAARAALMLLAGVGAISPATSCLVKMKPRNRADSSSYLTGIPWPKNETLGHENHLLNNSPLYRLRHGNAMGRCLPHRSQPRYHHRGLPFLLTITIRVGAPAEEPYGHKQALRGVTSHLVTDMCMYSHANVGVSPHNCGKVTVRTTCPAHAVSVTCTRGVTTAGMSIFSQS